MLGIVMALLTTTMMGMPELLQAIPSVAVKRKSKPKRSPRSDGHLCQGENCRYAQIGLRCEGRIFSGKYEIPVTTK
jgi:hypothetical protein